MGIGLWCAAAALISVAVSAAPQAEDAAAAPKPPTKEALGKPVPQPIPYSHKTHLALGLQCQQCHTIPDPGFSATFPKEEACMACHQTIKADSPAIQKLAEFHKNEKPVPWERVYRVPDYVWFSHELHHKEAKVACETCHGPVAERDVLGKEKSTSMASCMTCHAEMQAANECDVCHDHR
jgi:hypothetical protein